MSSPFGAPLESAKCWLESGGCQVGKGDRNFSTIFPHLPAQTACWHPLLSLPIRQDGVGKKALRCRKHCVAIVQAISSSHFPLGKALPVGSRVWLGMGGLQNSGGHEVLR